MPVVVPPPIGEPLDTSSEITINRSLTKAFIDSMPTQIELVPYARQRKPSGGFALVAGTPRPMQTFRLIPMSHTERPARSSSTAIAADDGIQRRYDYTLLGNWDAEMEKNDRWTTPNGQILKIDSIVSFNGYERKAMITSYGGGPEHG